MIFIRLSFRLGFAFVASVLLANSVTIASNARLTALSQDKNGSLLIEDERNIFLNPGYLGTIKNAANFELGASRVTTSASNDTGSSPKAEGGIVYGGGSFMTAIQVGRTHRLAESMINNSRLSTGGFFIPQNSLELMLGKGGDLSWGGSVHYAKTASDRGQTANFPDSEASILSLSGGVYKSSFAAFASVDLIHKSETKDSIGTPEKYEGKIGYVVGGSFNFNAFNKVSLTVDNKSFAFNNGAGTEGDSKSLQTVLNYFHRFSEEKVFLFVIAGLSRGESVISYAAPGSTNEKLTTWSLPLSLGVEIPANSWLTVQTSVKQAVLINSSNATNGTTDLATEGLVLRPFNFCRFWSCSFVI